MKTQKFELTEKERILVVEALSGLAFFNSLSMQKTPLATEYEKHNKEYVRLLELISKFDKKEE